MNQRISTVVQRLARKILPVSVLPVLRGLRDAKNGIGDWRQAFFLAYVRGKAWSAKPGSFMQCMDYRIRINDGPNAYILFKDIFIKRIYHFSAKRQDPLILDCGSNIGMSILYFKHVYPRARIIGIEPDPSNFPILQENISNNKLKNVQLLQAAVNGQNGSRSFYADGKCGGCLAEYLPGDVPSGWRKQEVTCISLRDLLTEPVDFLKMNIEGAEYEVLTSSADRLRMVREMVVEYHHLPGVPRALHKILALLDEQGFDYLLNDFDSESNGDVTPPFRLTSETRYYLLIYARRLD